MSHLRFSTITFPLRCSTLTVRTFLFHFTDPPWLFHHYCSTSLFHLDGSTVNVRLHCSTLTVATLIFDFIVPLSLFHHYFSTSLFHLDCSIVNVSLHCSTVLYIKYVHLRSRLVKMCLHSACNHRFRRTPSWRRY